MKERIPSKVLGIVLAFLIMASTFVALPSAVSAAKFNIGDTVEVCNTGTKGLVVRDAPAGNQIGGKFDGNRGTILKGPEAVAYQGVVYSWWKARWEEDGLEGWSAEGYPGGVDYLRYLYVAPSAKFNIGARVEVYDAGASLV